MPKDETGRTRTPCSLTPRLAVFTQLGGRRQNTNTQDEQPQSTMCGGGERHRRETCMEVGGVTTRGHSHRKVGLILVPRGDSKPRAGRVLASPSRDLRGLL